MKQLTTLALTVLGCSWAGAAPIFPAVGSGTLVAQFIADPNTVSRDGSNNVLSWTASNNNAIVLTGSGTPLTNIVYDPTGMNGSPALVVNDFADQIRVLTGTVPGTRTATTVFWLGYYSPGRNGSLTDSAGQYAYSYGADGVDGSQLDHQIDNGAFQMFGGNGTQTGSSIAAFNSTYTVWTTFYGEGTGNGHSAFANNTNLNIPTPNGGNYSVTGQLMLFGFQTGTPGVSGGFNFVGNMSELIIFDGLLSANDVSAVQTYLNERALGSQSAVPEPGTAALLAAALLALGAAKLRRR